MRIKFYSSYCLIACLLFASRGFSQAPYSGPWGTLNEKPNTPINEMIGGYIEILPPGYGNPGNTTRYPLLIFLEGQGELGNGDQVELQRLYGASEAEGMLPGIARANHFQNDVYNFIVIVPQVRSQVRAGRISPEKMASPGEVNDIINYALQNYRVDANRVYLTGYSLGGGSTWNYAGASQTNANRLAAIVPFSGASNLADNMSRDDNIGNANLPVWTFVNNADATYKPLAQAYINAISAIPAHTEDELITIYSTGDHNSWAEPLLGHNILEGGNTGGSTTLPNNIYQWLLSNSRSLVTSPVFATVDAGSNHTINLANGSMVITATGVSFTGASFPINDAVVIPASGRTYTYEWKRIVGNGGSISGANTLTPTITDLKPGSYTFQLRATDNSDPNLVSVDNMNITVSAPPENKYLKVEAEAFSSIDPGVGVYDHLDEGPTFGLGSLDPAGGVFKGANYNTVPVSQGTYKVYVRYIGGGTVNIISGGTTVSLPLPFSGTWTTASANIDLNANPTIRFESRAGGWDFNYFELAQVSSAGGPLPVKFVYFNSLCRDGLVSLEWKTAQEVNSSRFAVERSSDGVHWSEIASVVAAGQSSDPRTYSYQDRSGGSSNSLYRIVEYDYNGQTTLSSIVRGNCGQARDAFSLYPNPSSSGSTLSVSLQHASKLTLRVMDSKGAVVEQRSLQLPSGNSSIPLNVTQYAKGIYTVQVYVSYNGEVKTLKLIRK